MKRILYITETVNYALPMRKGERAHAALRRFFTLTNEQRNLAVTSCEDLRCEVVKTRKSK